MDMHWSKVMKAHAKSFHLASLFFSRKVFLRVKLLYALCRWIDDTADEAPDPATALKGLDAITNDLHSKHPKMELNQLIQHEGLDSGYIDDLVAGAKLDLSTVRIHDDKELIQYSYLVAGTVGLAMAELMGVTRQEARAFAVDLGIAMQITNISRDVLEDAEMNRVYVPLTLLQKYELTHEDILNKSASPERLSQVIRDLLNEADMFYSSGSHGLKAIPWRSRGAVIIAAELYRGIGVKLLKNGGNPMLGRAYLSKKEKAVCLARGLGKWIASLFWKNTHIHCDNLHVSLGKWKHRRRFA